MRLPTFPGTLAKFRDSFPLTAGSAFSLAVNNRPGLVTTFIPYVALEGAVCVDVAISWFIASTLAFRRIRDFRHFPLPLRALYLMPYVSKKQEAWAHTPAGEKALGGPAKVAEWDAASRGRPLPARAGGFGLAEQGRKVASKGAPKPKPKKKR